MRREQIDFSKGHSWSQQRLADEAGLTAPIIGKIERGQQAQLDGEILHGLARAFQLTSFERREFFAMASDVTDEEIVRSELDHEKVFAQVWALLDSLRAPAFLMDPFADLIGVNQALLAFHDMSTAHLKATQTTDTGVNNMALLLAPDARFRQLLGQSWHRIALANTTQWRAMTLRYRHTPRFQQIFSILSTYPEFQMFWAAGHDDERGDDDYSRLRSYTYTHGSHGPVGYTVFTTTSLSAYGEFYLSTFVPQDRITDALFHELADKNRGALALMPWPNSDLQ